MNENAQKTDSKVIEAAPIADICLILEGTYPYIPGGVSGWTHQLIEAQHHFTFHLLTLLAPDSKEIKPKYVVPDNVIGSTKVILQALRKGDKKFEHTAELLAELEAPLSAIIRDGYLEDMIKIMRILKPHIDRLGSAVLLNSKEAWELLIRMYNKGYQTSPFLDYFWTWRALLDGMYSVMLADLPKAKVYHAVSTGYAGLFLARAHIEEGRPTMVTEHGIYTNERKIEIIMADWLFEDEMLYTLSVNKDKVDLRDMWVNTFISYSHCCYKTCDKVITLFEGNQEFQREDGAVDAQMEVIPNGIDLKIFATLEKETDKPPTIALIGRVVPIKDIKTYIRACGMLKKIVHDLRAFICGPTEEDEDYFNECINMIEHMGLTETIIFTGKIKLHDYLPKIDVSVLTSISEAQPLVILEAGAAGIPTVATDVGACREMLLGSSTENPPLGDGGAVVPLSNPEAVSSAIAKLLTDKTYYEQCSKTIVERVSLYYNKDDLDRTYFNLYAKYCKADSKPLIEI